MSVGLSGRSVATAAPSHAHPNPGNFANRSHDELSAMGQKGGKKGGKARGVGGFHNMDTKKQVSCKSNISKWFFLLILLVSTACHCLERWSRGKKSSYGAR
jgi:hypothetical protein